MAAGTFAKVADSETIFGNKRTVQYNYTGNAAYSPGGDAPTLPLRKNAGMIVLGQNTASLGVQAVWNSTTLSVQLFWTGAAVSGLLAEFSGNASTFVFALLFISTDD